MASSPPDPHPDSPPSGPSEAPDQLSPQPGHEDRESVEVELGSFNLPMEPVLAGDPKLASAHRLLAIQYEANAEELRWELAAKV